MEVTNLRAKIKNFKYGDFDLDSLMAQKKEKGLRTAVIIPVLNEASTLGPLIDDIRFYCGGFVDSIAVFDSGSTDGSDSVCHERGVPFVRDLDAAERLGLEDGYWKTGKGFNMWASLHYLRDHDIISFLDGDLKDFDPRFVYGVMGPLIQEDDVVFSKGRYYRPETDNRVTRILAEPLMSSLFPETRDFVDPLCGLYGGKTEFLRSIPFYSGYSVEVATLINALESTNPSNVAQVYLGRLENREHDNRYLGQMSGSIAYTLLKIANEQGIIGLNGGLSSQIIQQRTKDGVEFVFEKQDIEDLKLRPMREVDERAKAKQVLLSTLSDTFQQ